MQNLVRVQGKIWPLQPDLDRDFPNVDGAGAGFPFESRHYAPYSEPLSLAVRNGAPLGLLQEEEHETNWGGFYSIYTTAGTSDLPTNSARSRLARLAAAADPVQLELAATAAFLANEGISDPWEMTEKLKPEKTRAGNLQKAKSLYRKFAQISTPRRLPDIVQL